MFGNLVSANFGRDQYAIHSLIPHRSWFRSCQVRPYGVFVTRDAGMPQVPELHLAGRARIMRACIIDQDLVVRVLVQSTGRSIGEPTCTCARKYERTGSRRHRPSPPTRAQLLFQFSWRFLAIVSAARSFDMA